MNRDSKIWLSKNIKLDKDYKAVLNYSEADLIQLMENQNNLVYYNNKYQFLRDTGEIIVQLAYGTCLQANYMAFQNPDYSNKIFFAFIDSVEYISEKASKIKFTIDIWSTWFSYWDAKACFVIREHVRNDAVGANTIPEDVETGDYISTKLQPSEVDLGETCFAVASTSPMWDSYSTFNQILPVGVYYAGFTTIQGVLDYIAMFDNQGRGDAIVSVFVIPKSFFLTWGTASGIDGEVSARIRFDYSKSFTIPTVNYLGNDYVPVNKKLLTYPYSFLQVSNHSGQIVNYRWENFNMLVGESTIGFSIHGALTPSGSFICTPVDYNNMLNNYDDNIVIGKLPIGAYQNDAYTNWLTQQGVNIGVQTLASTASIVGGIVTANPLLAGGGVVGIAGTVKQMYEHSMIPPQASGNVAVGDVNFTMGLINLEFKRMSIKNEFASVIDNYFTRMGYKINRLKVPNMSHRQNYNFVQIASDDNTAFVNNHNGICPPSKDIEAINNLFRRGITIWNNHNNLGDYSVSNNITN